ncbi:hypothetical protein LTR84_011884 [Exophiala bonariae]|uniref:Peptidase S8/S53 domain-containing protein n=1 Tax=Exophiala bonariae TaxID=1690606 RepID=A0AAV9NHF9_9EURO|nr:hypothetical protein LTR84_011884 [Exophiala bonariae]
MSANPQVKDGDIQLSKPFSIVIAKPANKKLPHRDPATPFVWITEVDRLARQEDTAANYSASRWYAAAAFEAALAQVGPTDINTLHIEQFLAQNLFDDDRQTDALKLFNDILDKCAQVKTEGRWNFRYGNVAKSAIGCKCEYAQGFYSKRRFGRAGGEFERAWKISQNLLGSNDYTTKIKNKYDQAVKKRAEALQAKAALPPPSTNASTTEVDKTQAGKKPSSPFVTVEKTPGLPSNIVVPATAEKDPKGRGNTTPNGSRSPSREDDKPRPSNGSSSDKSSSQIDNKGGKGNTSPKPEPAKGGSQAAQNNKPSSTGHLQVPEKPRSSSVGGKPRKSEANEAKPSSGTPSVPRRNSDSGTTRKVVYGKTFDVEDSKGTLTKIDNLKDKGFNEAHKQVAVWGENRLRKTHEFLVTKCRNNVDYEEGEGSRKNKRRVRIAVLDTGVSMKHPEINARKERIKGFYCDIKGLENKANEDTSGHGTSTALLLMQVAPEADIYVARVFRETKDVVPDQVAPAIEHAVKSWEVDIISMSFGFPSVIFKMDQALKLAAMNDVLLFAAASNDGANEDITRAWPARDDSKVFCIHATDALGNSWKGNPPKQSATHNFATLGENVLTTGKQHTMVGKTGTSMATPIAAATAALLIDFSRLPKMKGKKFDHIDSVATFQGMKRLLLATSPKTEDGNFRYIKPWHLFSTNKYEYDAVWYRFQTELRTFF